MLLRVTLIGALALTLVTSGPVPFQGKENVYSYRVSVGKEADQLFNQGFILDLNLVARRRSDSSFLIRVSKSHARLASIYKSY